MLIVVRTLFAFKTIIKFVRRCSNFRRTIPIAIFTFAWWQNSCIAVVALLLFERVYIVRTRGVAFGAR